MGGLVHRDPFSPSGTPGESHSSRRTRSDSKAPRLEPQPRRGPACVLQEGSCRCCGKGRGGTQDGSSPRRQLHCSHQGQTSRGGGDKRARTQLETAVTPASRARHPREQTGAAGAHPGHGRCRTLTGPQSHRDASRVGQKLLNGKAKPRKEAEVAERQAESQNRDTEEEVSGTPWDGHSGGEDRTGCTQGAGDTWHSPALPKLRQEWAEGRPGAWERAQVPASSVRTPQSREGARGLAGACWTMCGH